MKQKSILCLGGGGQMGVFGAGVVTGLQEEGIYNKFEAIYGCSAGVFNGAYFLSRQSMFGSKIYWENLTGRFINKKNIFWGTLPRFYDGYVRPLPFNKILNAMNLDILIHVAKKEKILNLKALKKQHIPLYAKLLDTKNFNIRYIDIRKGNTLDLLHQSCSAIPYYYPSKNKQYIDAAIKEPLGIEYLLNKYPGRKIIVVFNLSIKRNAWHHIKNFIEGVVANSMYRGVLFKAFMKREPCIRKDLELAQRNGRVLLVTPNKPIQSWTKDKDMLKFCHEMGRKKAKELSLFLNS